MNLYKRSSWSLKIHILRTIFNFEQRTNIFIPGTASFLLFRLFPFWNCRHAKSLEFRRFCCCLSRVKGMVPNMGSITVHYSTVEVKTMPQWHLQISQRTISSDAYIRKLIVVPRMRVKAIILQHHKEVSGEHLNIPVLWEGSNSNSTGLYGKRRLQSGKDRVSNVQKERRHRKRCKEMKCDTGYP